VRPTSVPFSSRFFFFFLITTYITAMEAVRFSIFLSLCIYLFFSSFIHIWKRQARSWFLDVLWPKLNYNHVTPFQNVSLTIWPIAFIFLRKGLFSSSTAADRPTGNWLNLYFFPVLWVSLTKCNFPNSRTHILCGGLFRRGRINGRWFPVFHPKNEKPYRNVK
jgi:hypothetical protein